MAPLTRCRAGEGNAPTALNARYYSQRAGAGLIISEATQISPTGQGYPFTPGIYSPAQREGWKLVTDAVHGAGGRMFAQLWHVGRVSHPSFQPHGAAPLAPSAIALSTDAHTLQGKQPRGLPHAMSEAEIRSVIEDYAHAARVAKDAGFDGVELHGANGYLPDQFLRDGTNRRSDRYGGSIANRARFMLEALDAIIGVWGAGRVGFRSSSWAAVFAAVLARPLRAGLRGLGVVAATRRARLRSNLSPGRGFAMTSPARYVALQYILGGAQSPCDGERCVFLPCSTGLGNPLALPFL